MPSPRAENSQHDPHSKREPTEVTRRLFEIALVDPSLFCLPYDTELAGALADYGHKVKVYGRRLRKLEDRKLPDNAEFEAHFYRLVDRWAVQFPKSKIAKAVKAVAHISGLLRLAREFKKRPPDIVHLQWSPFPLADKLFVSWLKRHFPVVFTAHNSVAAHGVRASKLQTDGLDEIMNQADAVIVHVQQTKAALQSRGVAEQRVHVIKFPPIPMRVSHPQPSQTSSHQVRILQFGTLKPYKGIDFLVEAAISLLNEGVPMSLRIAGKPFYDISPLLRQIEMAGATEAIKIDANFLTEAELDLAIRDADIVVFPYLEIDGSAALAIMQEYRKAIIVTDVGMFSDLSLPSDVAKHCRIRPADADALAAALAYLINNPDVRRENAKAMSTALEEFGDWKEAARIHSNIYASLI